MTSVSPPAPHAPPSNWNLPNGLTLLRILMVPVFGWLLLAHGGEEPLWRVAAFVAFLAAMLTDRLDGEIARRRGLVTNFGKIADPIADKALTGMAFVGLSLIGDLWWWVTIVVLVREWGITALRFWVIRYGVISASYGGKAKTLAQIIANRLPMLRIVQDGGESGDDADAFRRQRVLHPTQRLYDTHRRTARPVQLARCRVLEVDLQLVELNRTASSISVDHNV